MLDAQCRLVISPVISPLFGICETDIGTLHSFWGPTFLQKALKELEWVQRKKHPNDSRKYLTMQDAELSLVYQKGD